MNGFTRGLLFLALTAVSAWAEVQIAPLFTDHAVLQRGRAIPVWGTADAGEQVTVEFRAHVVTATADAAGKWRVELPAQDVGPAAEFVVRGKNTVRLRDVVVGEVWLCSGQSNMAFRVDELEQPEEEAAAEFPGIRQFAVAAAVAAQPADKAKGAWVPASAATVGRFTATGYYFARELHRRLGVPVGIINSSVPGTPVESWLSADALASDPAFVVVGERWAEVLRDYTVAEKAQAAVRTQWEQADQAGRLELARRGIRPGGLPPGPGHRNTPAGLFNAMVSPLVPYALRGMLWDQGATNAPRASEYGALMKALITDWRQRWGEPALPFLLVQAPNFRDPNSPGYYRAALRLAQAEALAVPGVAMAVTIDIGDPGNAHPHNKREVGRRLALIARAQVYGEKEVAAFGPVLASVTREAPGVVRVAFKVSSPPLMARTEPLGGFELAGADGIFHPAEARIDGAAVLLTAATVKEPRQVRYAWGDDPASALADAAGLPAAPLVVEVK